MRKSIWAGTILGILVAGMVMYFAPKPSVLMAKEASHLKLSCEEGDTKACEYLRAAKK